MRSTSTLLIFLLLGILATASAAENKGAPIIVEADRLELDQQSGISIYQGNVRLQQETMLLTADRLELHTREGKLSQTMAEGSPVQLELKEPKTGEITRAEASYIEYRFADGVLELKGNAHLWRGGDEFSGKHLIYDTANRAVRAFGDKQQEGNGRVRVILQPESERGDE